MLMTTAEKGPCRHPVNEVQRYTMPLAVPSLLAGEPFNAQSLVARVVFSLPLAAACSALEAVLEHQIGCIKGYHPNSTKGRLNKGHDGVMVTAATRARCEVCHRTEG
eukprot:1138057-Pelagomonas_calceolata.AAC.8